MAYLGNSPGVASQRVVTTFTATAGQTVFTPQSGYTLGYCDVFLNGIKLVNGDDYTASNGTSITLTSGAAVGDSVEVVAYFPRGLSDGYLKSEADALLAQKQASLGYTPVNKAGDTMTGNLAIASYLNTANGSYIGAGNYLVSGGGSSDTGILTSGNILFATNGGAGNTERMRIDPAGRVTKPYQPAFRAVAPSNINYTTANTKITVHTYAHFNIGGHYDTNNQRFTAPIGGRYMFLARAWIAHGSTTQAGIVFRINGQNNGTLRMNSSTAEYSTLQPMIIVQLAAGDYVELFTEDCSGSGVVHTSSGDSNSLFAGYMLG